MHSREKRCDMLKEQTLQEKQKQLKERGKCDQLKKEKHSDFSFVILSIHYVFN